uniref:Cadherin domain-containing protein n=1 Tax=Trichuris muris TaxID=70415 RepID=A0A5S6R3E8_TRIMR
MLSKLLKRTCRLRVLIVLLCLASCFPTARCHSECVVSKSYGTFGVIEVSETIPAGVALVSTSIEPPEADIGRLYVDGGLSEFYADKFMLKKLPDGRVEVITNSSLNLPTYPSAHTQTTVSLSVLCNRNRVSLASVQISATNRHAPEWYGLPYKITVPEDTPLNVLIKTPIICVDWDPAPSYNISFEIDTGGEEANFSLITLKDRQHKLESLPSAFSIASKTWERDRLPRIVYLQLKKRLDYDFGIRVYRLNVTAKDTPLGGRQRAGTTTLTVHVSDSDDLPPVFSSAHYFGSIPMSTQVGSAIQVSPAISARDGDADINAPIMFSLLGDGLPFRIDEETGTIFLNGTIPYHMVHSSVDLELKAAQRDNPMMATTATVHLRFVGSQSALQLCRITVAVPTTAGAEVVRLHGGRADTKFALETEEEGDRDLFHLEPTTDRILVRRSNADDGKRSIFKILTVPLNSDFVVETNETSTGVCSAAIVAVLWSAETENMNEHLTRNVSDPPSAASFEDQSAREAVRQNRSVDAVLFVYENETPSNLYQVSLNAKPRNEVYYKILNLGQRCCHIDSRAGWISVRKGFDYETTKGLLLNVSACPMPLAAVSDPKCWYFLVQIVVVDQNDNSPMFDKPIYEATIPVYAEQRTRVIQVFATDRDDGQNGRVSYALKRSVQPFTVDYNTGWLLTSEVLTEPRLYNFTVIAFDHGIPSRESYCNIIVNVTSSQTWAPRFHRTKYSATVPEDISVGTAVVQVAASLPSSDGDGGNISYRFVSNDSLPFTVDAITGIVRTAALLDFEATKSYTFLMVAVNHGVETRFSNPALVSIHVTDVNDNAPVFGLIPNRVVLPAFVQEGTVVLNISATDADSDFGGNNAITYDLEQSSDAVFRLERTTGRLVLLQMPPKGDYAVTVIARDRGQPSLNATLTVRFKVAKYNSGDPVFRSLHFHVEAMACPQKFMPLRRFHAILARSSAIYELLPTVTGLQIDNVTGILFSTPEFCGNVSRTRSCIVRGKNPNNESLYSDVPVTVDVHADDLRRAPLEFIAPRFYVSVLEGTPAGQDFGFCVLLKEPLHPRVTFSLEKNEMFAIKKDGCILFSQPADLERLPHNLRDMVSLKAYASDGISTAATLLQIRIQDVNEFAPRFDHSFYRLSLPEDCAPGTTLLTLLAKDEDATDTHLTYSVLNGEHDGLVEIDQLGHLVKSSLRMFDRELEPTVRLTVMVADKGNLSDTATVEITILDVNDNPPRFLESSYTWLIMEGPGGVGSRLGMYCRDPDEGANGTMSFRLLPEALAALFHVQKEAADKVSLTLLRPLDREERSHLFLLIEARDHGTPTLISAARLEIELLDVNDNAPSFVLKDVRMSLPCEMAAGIPFAMLSAVDLDVNCDLNYRIVSDDTGAFYLDAKLPLLSIEQSYGRLAEGVHRLTVTVTDGIFNDTATVAVDVHCLQDQHNETNALSFSQSSHVFNVYEGKGHSFVGRLQANGSSNARFTVIPFQQGHFFQVNQAAEVYSNTSLIYQKDNDTVVFVVCSGIPSATATKAFTSVAVQIMDVNDHPPAFQRASFFEILPLSVSPGHPLSSDLTALDSFDEGVNAKVWYELKGKDAACFGIAPDIGRVTSTCDFASSAKRRYEFFIVATDQEGSGLSATANVSVSVVPVEVYLQQWKEAANSVVNFPLIMPETPRSCRTMLIADHVTANVPMNALFGTVIFILSSLIAEQARRFHFRFANATAEKEMPFAVDGQHDLLIVSKPLQGILRAESDYVIRIVASQNLLRLICPVEVTVRVIGQSSNHQPFRFTNRLFNFSIDENLPAGSVIGQLNHTCADPNEVSYKVVSFGRTSNLGIGLNANGTLFSNRAFDREKMDMEALILVEGSCNDDVDLVAVNVTVNDVNDNAPRFTKSLYKFSIPEGPYNSHILIGYVSAHDADRGSSGEVQYAILEEGVPFSVRNGGGIYVSGRIDRETNDTFNFTVLGFDRGLPSLSSTAAVSVTVVDVNDNAPVFDLLPAQINVTCGAETNMTIGRVHAFDLDSGLNGVVSYDLIAGDDLFNIDENGIIRNKYPLNTGTSSHNRITVTAFDLGSPSLSTEADILIVLNNGSESRFDSHSSSLISEFKPNPLSTSPVGWSRLQPAYGTLPSVLASTPTSHPSLVTASPNVVRTFTEMGLTYRVELFYTEPSNETVFDEKEYWTSVIENLPPPQFILDLNCSHERNNLPTFYKIKNGDKGRFAINETTGQLYTTAALDRENQSLYIIAVQCTSFPVRAAREAPAKFNFSDLLEVGLDSTLVVVNVLDDNDNPPRFEEENSLALFYLKTPPQNLEGCKIGSITAVDPDATSVVSYSIENKATDDSAKFLINRATGLLDCSNWTDVAPATGSHAFRFTVAATDLVHVARKSVAVIPIAIENSVTLSALRSPDYVTSYKRSIERKLEDHLGFYVHLDEIRPLKTVIAKGSEIDVYAVDKVTLEPIESLILYRRLYAAFTLLQDDLNHLRLLSVETDAFPAPSWESELSSSSPLATVDLALICVITVVAIVSVIVAVLLVRSFSFKRERSSPLMSISNSSPVTRAPVHNATLATSSIFCNLTCRRTRLKTGTNPWFTQRCSMDEKFFFKSFIVV